MDKVQKIREEVEKITKGINPFIPDEDGENSEFESGRLSMAIQILQLIDSLQEELKFKVGDKVMYLNEEYVITDNKDHYTLRSTKERTSVPVVHIDFGNEDYELRLVEESKEDFEKVVEEIVDPTVLNAYGVKEIANRLRRTMTEPVSEVLLDTTQTITYKGEVYTRCYKDELDAFACKYPMSVPKSSKRYAKYSDVDLTITVKEGAKWQKQQMMTKAVEVEISDNGCTKGLQFIPVWPFTDEYVGGDKVKLIIIKED